MVVEMDVPINHFICMLKCLRFLPVDALCFENSKEIFCQSIVIAVSRPLVTVELQLCSDFLFIQLLLTETGYLLLCRRITWCLKNGLTSFPRTAENSAGVDFPFLLVRFHIGTPQCWQEGHLSWWRPRCLGGRPAASRSCARL